MICRKAKIYASQKLLTEPKKCLFCITRKRKKTTDWKVCGDGNIKINRCKRKRKKKIHKTPRSIALRACALSHRRHTMSILTRFHHGSWILITGRIHIMNLMNRLNCFFWVDFFLFWLHIFKWKKWISKMCLPGNIYHSDKHEQLWLLILWPILIHRSLICCLYFHILLFRVNRFSFYVLFVIILNN